MTQPCRRESRGRSALRSILGSLLDFGTRIQCRSRYAQPTLPWATSTRRQLVLIHRLEGALCLLLAVFWVRQEHQQVLRETPMSSMRDPHLSNSPGRHARHALALRRCSF